MKSALIFISYNIIFEVWNQNLFAKFFEHVQFHVVFKFCLTCTLKHRVILPIFLMPTILSFSMCLKLSHIWWTPNQWAWRSLLFKPHNSTICGEIGLFRPNYPCDFAAPSYRMNRVSDKLLEANGHMMVAPSVEPQGSVPSGSNTVPNADDDSVIVMSDTSSVQVGNKTSTESTA